MVKALVQPKKASVPLAGKSSKSKSLFARRPVSTESEDFSGDESFPVSGSGIDLDWGSIPVNPPASTPQVQAAPEETEEKEIQEKEDKEEVQLKENAIASSEEEEKVQAKEEDEEIQLKVEEEEKVQAKEEEEEVQLKEINDEESIQTKLSIGKPGDQYEQEADRVARKVIEMSEPAPKESVQRQPEAAKEKEKPEIQAKGQSASANADFEQNLSQGQGGGSPLGNETKGFMESRFGTDFSGVRVHTDSNAVQMNKQIGAQAFTHGKDVYFNAGKFNPGSSSGKELLAHELTHTIQQTGGTPRAKSLDTSEKKENKVQAKALSSLSGGLSAIVQRREDAIAAQPVEAAPAPEQNAPASTEEGSGGGGETAQNAPEAPQQEADAPAPQAPQEGAAPQANAPQAAAPAPSGEGGSAPASPEADPDFQAVVTKSQGVAEEKKQHEPADSEAKAAQEAAESPANEVESQAQDVKVGEMEQEPTGTFDAEQFKQDLLNKIEAILPQNEGEAENFGNNNELDSVKNDVSSGVQQEQEEAGGALEDKAQEEPDTSGIEPREAIPLEPTEPTPPPANLGGENAVPKPKSEGEVSAPLQENSQNLDNQMSEAGVTEEQLQNANEPSFTAALDAKQQTQEQATTAPGVYRQQEQGIITQAQGEAKTTVDTRAQAMHGEQEQVVAQVIGLQDTTKGQDEGKRSEIANEINTIYESTKADVDKTLGDLDEDVSRKFNEAADRAKQAFEDYVNPQLDAYKQERYGEWYDVTGWDERLTDAWNGQLPDEVNKFFEVGRNRYLAVMDAALSEISALVANTLNRAKEMIRQGKLAIQNYVLSLPEEQRQMGEEAAQNIQGKFDELEANVDSKRDELIDSLAQQYSEKLQAIDQQIEDMKQVNQGLFGVAKNLLGGVITKILEAKQMLEGVLGNAAGAIGKIIMDPIKFLGNLVKGIGQGFNNFAGNILKHLQSGLIGWLTGTLGSMGIQMPEDIFSLEGIFSLVTQVLGLTWDYVRGKAVKMFGEPVVAAMETAADIFLILRSEGLPGVWEYVQDKFTDLQESVMGEIKNMVITQVIQSGVMWVLSLLNPASAFFKAIKMIYDVVMFFVNRGSQIVSLVQAISQSITSIANGQLEQTAKFIEDALAKSMPVVLGFLASVLGISGLAKKVQKIIEAIRDQIDEAIDAVLEMAKKAAKSVLKNLGLINGEDDEDGENETEHKILADQAIAELEDTSGEQKDYETLRKEKEQQANAIEQKYTAKLEEGVKMTVDFTDPSSDQQDGDIDFKVKIAPNDYEGQGTVNCDGMSKDEGTKSNPFSLNWPKSYAAQYPALYLGGQTDEIKDQKELANKVGKKDENGQIIKKYKPCAKNTLPDGNIIGIASSNRTHSGMVIGPLVPTGQVERSSENKFNELLESYGFKASQEGLDGDHVVELQVGGQDEVNNMWSLNSSMNRGSGPKINHTIVKGNKTGCEKKISDLKTEILENYREYYFKI